jgi:hypothetical protein
MTARTTQMTARIEQWLRCRLSPSDKYRPERHYMRGPGPKSMAKLGAQTGADAKPAKESKA